MAAAPSSYAPSDAYSGPSQAAGPSAFAPSDAYTGPSSEVGPSGYAPTGAYGGPSQVSGPSAYAGGAYGGPSMAPTTVGSNPSIAPSQWNIPTQTGSLLSAPSAYAPGGYGGPTDLPTTVGKNPSIAPSQWNIPEQGGSLLPTTVGTLPSIAPSQWNIPEQTGSLLSAPSAYDPRGYGGPKLTTGPATYDPGGYQAPQVVTGPAAYVPTTTYVKPGPPPPRAPTPESDDPPITSNFYLTIDGLSLTRWTEVSGLGMKFTTKNYQPGGGTTSQQLMAQKDLQTLTLVRPFAAASMQILPWFELYAHVNVPLTASLIACDMEGNPLYFWELEGVRPVEWNGPKFKAGEAAPAVETLKLVYTDFLNTGTGSGGLGAEGGLKIAGDVLGATLAAPRLFNLGSGMLGIAEAIAGAMLGTNGITFNIIPNSFKITSGVKISKANNAGMKAPPSQSWNANPRNLSFDFVLDCLTVDSSMLGNPLASLASPALGIQLQLMGLAALTGNSLWSGPLPNPAAMLNSALNALNMFGPQAAPTCLFMWGMFQFMGNVTSMNITINVLGLDGTPQRATVSITIAETAMAMLPGTNPTSGAEGATTTHMVVAGDSLASISYQTYGHADRWRGIAELNGIDDPLRLRPGTTLLLPKPADARTQK